MKCSTEIVIGMDLSNKKSEICEMNYKTGDIQKRSQVTNTKISLHDFFSNYKNPKNVLVAMEAGSNSAWISELLSEMNFQVLVGNSRKLRFIWKSENKSDKRDAEMLARIVRLDPKLFYPIKHKSKESQAMLAVLKTRDSLVKSRTQLVNSVRGMLKSMGYDVPSCSTPSFAKTLLKEMPEEFCYAVQGTLEIIGQMTREISIYDKKIEYVSENKYPETKILRQIKGVGALTALAYILIIEDPKRFHKSRHVGPYLGLVPKRDQSGEIDKQLGITKTGDIYLRKLLVQCAHYILGPFGDDCELRRFGEKLQARGGKTAKKKAIVAVARKLGILLHNLWLNESEYEKFHLKRNEKLKKSA